MGFVKAVVIGTKFAREQGISFAGQGELRTLAAVYDKKYCTVIAQFVVLHVIYTVTRRMDVRSLR
jgi:hypothetical protein